MITEKNASTVNGPFKVLRGLSTDSKPTDVSNGTEFVEINTGKKFLFNEAASAWVEQPASGGGTSDYTDLTNKPSINGVTLSGNKTTDDLGILPDKTEASFNDILCIKNSDGHKVLDWKPLYDDNAGGIIPAGTGYLTNNNGQLIWDEPFALDAVYLTEYATWFASFAALFQSVLTSALTNAGTKASDATAVDGSDIVDYLDSRIALAGKIPIVSAPNGSDAIALFPAGMTTISYSFHVGFPYSAQGADFAVVGDLIIGDSATWLELTASPMF